jgi:hypothetical protein
LRDENPYFATDLLPKIRMVAKVIGWLTDINPQFVGTNKRCTVIECETSKNKVKAKGVIFSTEQWRNENL